MFSYAATCVLVLFYYCYFTTGAARGAVYVFRYAATTVLYMCPHTALLHYYRCFITGATTGGAVYVFRLAAGAWVYHSVLTSALENQRFGWSVSIDKYATGDSGDTGRVRAVVGCHCRSPIYINTGVSGDTRRVRVVVGC